MSNGSQAELVAFSEAVVRLQMLGGSNSTSTTLKVGLDNLRSNSRGFHVSLSDAVHFLESLSEEIASTREALITAYIRARFPVGSTFRIKSFRSIVLHGAGDGEEIKLVPGDYRVAVVQSLNGSESFVRGVPEGMSQGAGMERWLEMLGLVVPGDSSQRAELLED